MSFVRILFFCPVGCDLDNLAVCNRYADRAETVIVEGFCKKLLDLFRFGVCRQIPIRYIAVLKHMAYCSADYGNFEARSFQFSDDFFNIGRNIMFDFHT